MVVLVILSLLIIPYRSAYIGSQVESANFWVILEHMFDLMFCIDIFVTFRTGILTDDDLVGDVNVRVRLVTIRLHLMMR